MKPYMRSKNKSSKRYRKKEWKKNMKQKRIQKTMHMEKMVTNNQKSKTTKRQKPN